MSNLAGMLAEFCPNGVELKKIADVTTVARGIRVVRNQLAEEGEFPVYQNSMKPLGYYEKANCPAKTTFVIGAGAAGEIGYCDIDFWAADDCYYLIHTKELDSRYLYHVLLSCKSQILSKVRKASVPRLARTVIENLVVPVPPIEIQYEIVSILDNFTELTAELTTELTTELIARKKQYQYYRDNLFKFDMFVPKVKLGDIATITRGGNFQKKDFVERGFPCIHYGQIYTSFGIYADKTIKNISENVAEKSKKAVKNDIVMAVTSENIDDVCKCVAWLGDNEIAVSGHTAIIHHGQNPKFLAYYFHTENFYKQKKKLAHGTKVIEVTPDKLNDIIIPLPSIEEQERIVSVLDCFNTLCNDLSNGLQAEIEARQKQYEYYRDKLLTFKELGE